MGNHATTGYAEYLEGLLTDGINGKLPVEELREGLDEVTRVTQGQRFEIMTDKVDSVVFCAGSWAVRQLYGSTDLVLTKITILGETEEGPTEVDLSLYDSINFVIGLK